MSELRERVARAIEASIHDARLTRAGVIYLPEADAAIAIVLEEAAKVADEYAKDAYTEDEFAGNYLAAAIRALKVSESDTLSKDETKDKSWKCPIGYPDCKENCGSYACGN